jgi:hypothetical protein
MKEFLGTKTIMRLLNLHIENTSDFKYYSSFVGNAEFYGLMMDEFKSHGIKFIDREDFKDQIFTVFFEKNDAFHYSPAVRLFGSIFPSIIKGFMIIKEPEYNKLSILL